MSGYPTTGLLVVDKSFVFTQAACDFVLGLGGYEVRRI
jgi:hypothetical protein